MLQCGPPVRVFDMRFRGAGTQVVKGKPAPLGRHRSAAGG